MPTSTLALNVSNSTNAMLVKVVGVVGGDCIDNTIQSECSNEIALGKWNCTHGGKSHCDSVNHSSIEKLLHSFDDGGNSDEW